LGAAPKPGVALCLRDVGKAGFAGPVCRKFANLTAFSWNLPCRAWSWWTAGSRRLVRRFRIFVPAPSSCLRRCH